jgi:hypothetical protein
MSKRSASSTSSPAPASSRTRRLPARPWIIFSLILVLTLAAGFFAGRLSLRSAHAEGSTGATLHMKPGAWGDLEYTRINIAAPEELLKVRGVETQTLQWYFEGTTRAELARLLREAGASAGESAALLAGAAENAGGVALKPSCAAIRDLDESARAMLYGRLAASSRNTGARWEFLARYLDTFDAYGASREAAGSVKAHSVSTGRFLVTYCMPCVLAEVSDPAEKAGILKALTQQPSMLVRLKVGPGSDIDALMAYWGKTTWSTNVRAMLESLRGNPGGGAVDLGTLLPPLPNSLLHAYPMPHNNLSGPETLKNCSWTAFNFFRDPPDPGFTDANYVLGKLETDYFPIQSDPRYGDVAIFLNPQQMMVHVATYLADDLYFTKNGDNPWHPWVFSTSEDLLEAFSFGLSEGQALSIHYFRNKYY